MNIGQEKGSLVHDNGVTIFGRVRFALDVDTQHSQKEDSDPLWSEVMKSFPHFGCACARPLLRIRVLLSMLLMSLFLSKDCSPCSSRVTFHTAILTLACLLFLLQPLHSTAIVLGFKWGNHSLTSVLCTQQHSLDYKRNML